MSWKQIDGYLQQLDIGPDYELWGVDDNQVFKWNVKSWIHAKGITVSNISVGADFSIWCTTKDHKIYRLVGGIDVSVGADGTCWGVNANHEIFRWDGEKWIPVDGSLKQIKVASIHHIVGVNDKNEIYLWENGDWNLIEGGLLKYVSISPEGTSRRNLSENTLSGEEFGPNQLEEDDRDEREIPDV
ncbi:3149_t:CDS:2 [Rhizophagus irregularis]|nr:3149_t:CDS:2 [Rhizophagus irregularis]